MRASTFLGFRQLLTFVTVFPAVENTLSEGVDVTGILRSILATGARLGNHSAFIFHHKSGEWFPGDGVSDKYCVSLSVTEDTEDVCSGPNSTSRALFFFFCRGFSRHLTSLILVFQFFLKLLHILYNLLL